jgi:hypothetical protein
MKDHPHKQQNGLEIIAKASAIDYGQPYTNMHETQTQCRVGRQQGAAFCFPSSWKTEEAGEVKSKHTMNTDSETTAQAARTHNQTRQMEPAARNDCGYMTGKSHAASPDVANRDCAKPEHAHVDAVPIDCTACASPISAAVWIPWIVFSKDKGLEVCKEAREVVMSLPSPVCIVLFYGKSESRLSRTAVLVRTLFPSSVLENTSQQSLGAEDVVGQDGDGQQEDDESGVVVRVWRKVVRVKAGDNKRVSVVIAEASPVPGMDEGLALALSSLICSHMVYCGQGVLDECRIQEELKSVHQLTKHVRARNHVGDGAPQDEEDGLSFNLYFPRLTWLLQDFQVRTLPSPSPPQHVLLFKHPNLPLSPPLYVCLSLTEDMNYGAWHAPFVASCHAIVGVVPNFSFLCAGNHDRWQGQRRLE